MYQKLASNPPLSDRWSYLWLVLGTVLMIFIGGSWPLPLAGWLASVFMLRFMRTRKFLQGYLLLVCGLSIANTIAWQAENPIPFPAFVFGIVLGLSSSLPFLVERLLVPRFRAYGRVPFVATLVFPLFLTASEFLVNTTAALKHVDVPVGYGNENILPGLDGGVANRTRREYDR